MYVARDIADAAGLGPGVLIFVVGPSGAGKDTLIGLARTHFAAAPDVLFARRLVTRPAGSGEAHGTLGESDFTAGCASGLWPLSWQAHGLSYALGAEVDDQVRAGHVAVANGSRAALPQARRRFARLRVVLVNAPAELRAARLAARGRESLADIRARLARMPQVDAGPDLVIENDAAPGPAAAALIAFIAGTRADAASR